MNALDGILNPRSVAVIGASRRRGSVGRGVMKSLLTGCVFKTRLCKPFSGRVYAINPNAKKILGRRCHASLLDVRGNVDLAVICVPAKIVPSVIKDCAKKQVKGAIIISAGFAEIGKSGEELQDKVIKIAKKTNIRLVGPNCLGIIRPPINLNASFGPSMPPRGEIAFISQSGALADSIIDWSIEERYGFSLIVSYGNQADLELSDFMEWCEKDKHTKAITLYIEGIKDGRKFMKIAKKMTKPIIAIKSGRTEAGTKAVSSHTGSLAGSFEIYKSAFKQSDVILVDTVEELFDVAKAVATQPPCKKNNIAIITNGGGCGVLAADYCEMLGVRLAKLTRKTIQKLEGSGKMHPAYSRRNPLDIVGDALPERYEVAINTLLEQKNVHGLIVIQTLQTMTGSEKDAKIVIKARKKFPDKPIVCTYMGGKFSRKGIKLLEKHRIPDFNDPYKSVMVMKSLIDRGEKFN
ncbi:CoA-binding protein [Candidatus Woesearchaeota archaeon]|nr:CoA-binding protein [Candidatus Woesearchaeota archaeon]